LGRAIFNISAALSRTNVADNVSTGASRPESSRSHRLTPSKRICSRFCLVGACRVATTQDRASLLWAQYQENEAKQLVPLVTQAIRFPTVAGNSS
jgi:hypothetical protein